MSTHPFLPLYVDDYDAATAHLTLEEDGIYSRLIRLSWRTPGCSLPNDPAWIARKIRVSATDYERVVAVVIGEFFTLVHERLIQKRLKAEYDEITRKKSARQRAGKSGGLAKAAKTKDNPSSNASDLLVHACAFPEPEPEPIELSLSKARATHLPAGWRPPDEILAWAAQEGFSDQEVTHETDKFRDYWCAIGGQRGAKLDWGATFRNWLRRSAQSRGGGRTAASPHNAGRSHGGTVSFADLLMQRHGSG